MVTTVEIEEIKSLLQHIPYNNGYEIHHEVSFNSKRLMDIYNGHIEFHRGKKENFNCRPCRLKVLYFFTGLVAANKLKVA